MDFFVNFSIGNLFLLMRFVIIDELFYFWGFFFVMLNEEFEYIFKGLSLLFDLEL